MSVNKQGLNEMLDKRKNKTDNIGKKAIKEQKKENVIFFNFDGDNAKMGMAAVEDLENDALKRFCKFIEGT